MASVADSGGTPPPIEPTETVVVRRRRPALTFAKWLAIILGVIVAAAAAFLIWLNSDSGRRFVVDQINGIEMASGLKIHVDSIEGSIWGRMTLRGLVLSDPKGAFFAAPVAEVDYRPLAYIRRSHVDIRSLVIPEARLSRLPELRSTDPNAPLIPNIDLDIANLRIGRLIIDPPVTGQRHLLSIGGDLHLANSAARANLDVNALRGPGIAGGDRLALRFEAAPEQDRLNIEMRVSAPADGFVASMTSIAKPLEIAVAGRGTWANWRGRLQAAMEGQPFANLDIRAENGTFRVTGPMRPDIFVTGPANRLTEPLTYFNLTTTWANRRADINLRMNSRALAIAAEGIVDFRASQFETMRVAARLMRPGAIAPNLDGRDVRLALVLDGAIRRPRIVYDLSAARLDLGSRTLENFRATGSARVDPDRIVVPVSGRIGRITGLPPTLGGLLTNVRINGDILVDWPNILSDNLRLRSDRADAVLTLAFDVGRGRYNVGVQGTVNNYLVESIGVFDITSNFDLVNQAGGFGIDGRVSVRSRRIFNATAADLLGGNAVATASVNVAPNGIIRIGDVRVSAPALRITEGGGVYYPDGRIALRLVGTSRRYGPVGVEIGGTVSAPQIQLNVANPGFGVGLRNVRATVRSTGQGYAIQATGESDYGPFSADVVVLARAGPMTIQVNRLLFAGLTFAGRVTQTAAGPFAGSLSVSGQGIDGNVALAAAGRRQRIDVAATANDAVIPSSIAGQNAITIARAIVDVGLTLPIAGDPFAVYEAEGDVQVAGLTSGSLQIDRGRTKFTYQGNAGNARFVATGASGVPFDIAGNADLSPERIRMALQGSANNIPFRFAQPALIERVDNAWLLRPTTVLFREGQGRLRLAGRYGDGLIIQSRLDSFDLSVVNTLGPSLGLGGQATGSLDFFLPPGGAFPRAEARLNIANFTRTGIAVRSVPVDVALAGNLVPEGGALSAVIREEGAIVGRIQARLQPLPPGAGTWTQRLASAPLSGGIRYNGPAGVLSSLVSMAGHQLNGPVGIGADFTGRLDNPQLRGVVRSTNLNYINEQYGTHITNLAIDGNFNGSQLDIVRLTGRAGEGTIQAEGEIGLSSAAGYPVRIDAQLANARLARSDDITATATGTLQIRNSAAEPAMIRGRLELGETRYQIVTQGAARVPQLAGVRRRGEPLPAPGQAVARRDTVPSIWNLDLRLVSDNQLYVTGMGLDSEWAANLRVTGRTNAPQLTGRVDLVRGVLGLAGRRFILDQQSHIDFVETGSARINPQLDIRAAADIEDVEVQVLIGGNATNPRIEFASSPGLPQDEIVSRILFGSSVTEISAIQAIQLAASLNSLRGGSGGLNPLGELQQATGIDRIRILGEDDTVGRGTAIAAGFYLSDDIYIEIITDAEGFTATQIEIALSRSLSLLSQFGTMSGTNVNLRYSRDY
ncbi:MAG: translocation/assembly module TamB domain-containing protein [Allosphingosinicella sp.]|uniref:translocation/assembly module TamB domain-containing protein n=1 Tax=Allosphingosinicella sp. TaxID=2823234 RepID=UPI00392E9B4A